jgi:putative transposase
LISRIKSDNPSWSAPSIHDELLHLGFEISEPTVWRYLQGLERRTDNAKAKRWLAFLLSHEELIAACHFFTVPKLTFQVLCVIKSQSIYI